MQAPALPLCLQPLLHLSGQRQRMFRRKSQERTPSECPPTAPGLKGPYSSRRPRTPFIILDRSSVCQHAIHIYSQSHHDYHLSIFLRSSCRVMVVFHARVVCRWCCILVEYCKRAYSIRRNPLSSVRDWGCNASHRPQGTAATAKAAKHESAELGRCTRGSPFVD